MKNKIIAVDFDGTLCEDKYPEIGKENYAVLSYILCEQIDGAKIILWTCRRGELLDNAIEWCKKWGLIFDAVNENLPEFIEKFGGDTRKIFADIYIDDRSVNPNTSMVKTTVTKPSFNRPIIKNIRKEIKNG